MFLGYEQANKYAIHNEQNKLLGYILEEDQGFKNVIARQLLRTRRPFKADVIDPDGNVVFRLHRPLQYFINSKIFVSDKNGREIGAVLSDFHLWRRRYDLFLEGKQVFRIDSGFLSWDFEVYNHLQQQVAIINRNFGGLIKEMFADAGQYVVNYTGPSQETKKTFSEVDERAVLLAGAISIDIDYFSRHSNSSAGSMVPFIGSMPSPIPIPVPVDLPGDGSVNSEQTPGTGAGSSGVDQLPSSTEADQFPTGSQQFPGDSFPDVNRKNQWGDDDFLTDDEAGLSSGEDSNLMKDVWDFFNDDE